MIIGKNKVSEKLKTLLFKSPPLAKEGQGGFGYTAFSLPFLIPIVLPLPKGETFRRALGTKTINSEIRGFMILLLCLFFTNAFSQTIATFEVDVEKNRQELDIPMQVNLADLTYLPDSVLSLVKVEGKEHNCEPVDLEDIAGGNQRQGIGAEGVQAGVCEEAEVVWGYAQVYPGLSIGVWGEDDRV